MWTLKQLAAGAALLALGSAAQASPLYLNGPVVDATGKSVLPSGATTLGYSAQSANNIVVADNFSVTLGETWDVQSLSFFAYQTGASAFSFSLANWAIVAGDVNTGTVLAAGTVSVTNEGLVGYRVQSTDLSSTARPIYQIGVDIPDLELSDGNYWVRWSLLGSLSTGPFVAPTSDASTGNAAQSQSGGPFNMFSAELPFAVNGVLKDASNQVPEPGSLALLLAGGVAALGVTRRRRSN